MSESVLLAGKRGSGKSLAACWKCAQYLAKNRPIATNMNLFVEHLVPAYNKTPWYRLPDWPTAEALEALPLGNPFLARKEGSDDPVMLPGFREDANGLLLLDEAGTFLNARSWQGEQRAQVINFLLQSRKYGWDLFLIAQHANLLDKQIRESLIEVQGTLKRLDKIRVPILSPIVKHFTGEPLHFPKMHYVPLKYGFAPGAPKADSLFFGGKEFYKAYDTLQRISPVTGVKELKIMPSAWEVKGQFMNKWDLRRQMAAGGLVLGFLIGFAGGVGAMYFKPASGPETVSESVSDSVKVRGLATDEAGREIALLTDGSTGLVLTSKQDKTGARYLVGKTWYSKP